MIISATKNNRMYYAQLPKMAEYIGIEPERLRRWRRSGLNLAVYNDFVIYFNTENL